MPSHPTNPTQHRVRRRDLLPLARIAIESLSIGESTNVPAACGQKWLDHIRERRHADHDGNRCTYSIIKMPGGHFAVTCLPKPQPVTPTNTTESEIK